VAFESSPLNLTREYVIEIEIEIEIFRNSNMI
jgi:hypothetical protein